MKIFNSEQNEMKFLIDMCKIVPKEQRKKVHLMVTEKKLQGDIEELRKEFKNIQDLKWKGPRIDE